MGRGALVGREALGDEGWKYRCWGQEGGPGEKFSKGEKGGCGGRNPEQSPSQALALRLLCSHCLSHTSPPRLGTWFARIREETAPNAGRWSGTRRENTRQAGGREEGQQRALLWQKHLREAKQGGPDRPLHLAAAHLPEKERAEQDGGQAPVQRSSRSRGTWACAGTRARQGSVGFGKKEAMQTWVRIQAPGH